MGADYSSVIDGVLIVDDSREYAAVLSRILTGVFSFKDVIWMENPTDALQLVKQDPNRFKLYFVDYNFPGERTGTDLLHDLFEFGALASASAFLITSEPTPENLELALANGALGVLAKPFDRSELNRQLEKAQRAWKNRETESF